MSSWIGVEDSIASICVEPNSSPYSSGTFWFITISNNTEDDLYVIWKKSQINNARIIFDRSTPLDVNLPIDEDIVFPNEFLNKRISHIDKVYGNTIFPMINLSEMKKDYRKYKKTQYQYVRFFIRIKHKNVEKTYKFALRAEYSGKRK